MTFSPRGRAVCLIAIPLLLSAILSGLLIQRLAADRLDEEADRYAQGVTDYLALAVTDHLLNDDKLGLNVVLAELLANRDFEFASVYGPAGQLIAQAGSNLPEQQLEMFTRQVTYQNTVAGRVVLGFSRYRTNFLADRFLLLSSFFHLLLMTAVLATTWFYGDLIAFWMFGRRSTGEQPEPETEEPEPEAEPMVRDGETSLLVIKLRPPRLVPRYRELVLQAIQLYQGNLVAEGPDDFVVLFEYENHAFQAVCTGLLLDRTFREVGPPVQIKLGVHLVEDPAQAANADQAHSASRKHASYLASISEQELLVSRRFFEALGNAPQYLSEPYRSSLTPDGEVFVINALTSQNLIDDQANQLLSALRNR